MIAIAEDVSDIHEIFNDIAVMVNDQGQKLGIESKHVSRVSVTFSQSDTQREVGMKTRQSVSQIDRQSGIVSQRRTDRHDDVDTQHAFSLVTECFADVWTLRRWDRRLHLIDTR